MAYILDIVELLIFLGVIMVLWLFRDYLVDRRHMLKYFGLNYIDI